MTEVLPFPFATVDDLKARWPRFPEGEEDYAETLLEDASQYILDVAPSAANAHARTRVRVLCAVVRRSMQVESEDTELGGMESIQVTTGPFSQTYKPNNSHGDFYLTRQEKLSLGVGKQEAFTVSVVGSSAAHKVWCDLMFNGAICSCGVDL